MERKKIYHIHTDFKFIYDSQRSIIVPTYNCALVITETLNSVFSQTHQNWECIIIDDGSTDNTEEVVQYYLKKDCRFQFPKRIDSYKKGGNGARNYGFDLSVGDFIQYLDAVDILSYEYFEKPFLRLKNKFA